MRFLLILLLAFPLLGSLYQVVAGKRLPRRWSEIAAVTAVTGALIMAVAAAVVAGGRPVIFPLMNWFSVGDLAVGMDVMYDPLAAVMAMTVTFIAVLVHLFSVFYMRQEAGYGRYYCYLNLFVFFMLVIVTADNLIFLFLGWEGVGFCSYALIGFWYQDAYHADAARKAFIMTRIGSAALGIAIGLIFATFGNLSLDFITHQAGMLSAGMVLAIGLLLLLAAAGKSALVPLSVWLPDAMVGPSPVSALIHAATMVTAGVYLLLRLYPVLVLSPIAMGATAAVGAVTALYGACSALAQHDIKRVLAYSTVSQLGFMVLGVGAKDPTGGLFHLLSQAFFKALLFLAAGCIIQSLGGVHDIFKMGRKIRNALPRVYGCFLIGALSLAAVPPTIGFFSKDRLLLTNLTHPSGFHTALWIIGTLTTLITALYIFRLFFLVFYGGPGPKRTQGPEPGPVRPILVWTLYPLAFLALAGGVINLPIGSWNFLDRYLAPVPGLGPPLGASFALEWGIRLGNAVVALVGIGLAYLAYGPRPLKEKPATAPEPMQNLLYSGFYLNQFFHNRVARPYERAAGLLSNRVDHGGIDAVTTGAGRLASRISMNLRLWATGRLSTYLGALLIGFTAMLCILALGLW
ncbi:MAG: NADH-quinone oxidoreductase subunit L [Thermodesulfobacteriota bacterium]